MIKVISNRYSKSCSGSSSCYTEDRGNRYAMDPGLQAIDYNIFVIDHALYFLHFWGK